MLIYWQGFGSMDNWCDFRQQILLENVADVASEMHVSFVDKRMYSSHAMSVKGGTHAQRGDTSQPSDE